MPNQVEARPYPDVMGSHIGLENKTVVQTEMSGRAQKQNISVRNRNSLCKGLGPKFLGCKIGPKGPTPVKRTSNHKGSKKASSEDNRCGGESSVRYARSLDEAEGFWNLGQKLGHRRTVMRPRGGADPETERIKNEAEQRSTPRDPFALVRHLCESLFRMISSQEIFFVG
ncbi:hypothetical protein Ancab_016772 [Ancistrocladus abbreviatus]